MRPTVLLCLAAFAVLGFVLGSETTATGPLQPSDELVSSTTTFSSESIQEVSPPVSEEKGQTEERQEVVQPLNEEQPTITSSEEQAQKEQVHEKSLSEKVNPITPPVGEEAPKGEETALEQNVKEEQQQSVVTTPVEEAPKEDGQEQPLNEQQNEPQQSEGLSTGEPTSLEEEVKTGENEDVSQKQTQSVDVIEKKKIRKNSDEKEKKNDNPGRKLYTDPVFDDIWQDVMRKMLEAKDHGKVEQKAAVGAKSLNAVQVTYDEERLRVLVEQNSKMSIESYHATAEHNPGEDEITLSYQSDCGRLENLERLAESWKGPISAAVFCINGDMDKLNKAKEHWAVKKFVNIHLCAADSKPEYYPVNKMRNTALLHVTTRRLFIVDADEFVAFDEAKARTSVTESELTFPKEEYIYAVASFQWNTDPMGTKIPQNIDALKANPNAVLRHPEFPPAYDPPGLGVENWKQLMKTTEIKFANDYEPYFVAHKERAGVFDERFIGWGGNKAIHLAKLHFEGVKFAIMPALFTFSDETKEVAVSHIKSRAVPGLYEEVLGKLSQKFAKK